jgi:antitoxin VapB
VALSIKNTQAERLAKELAKESGASVTASVIDALEQALRRVRGRRTVPSVREAILEVSERCAALPDLDTRSPEEILGYDERGVFS